MLTGDNPGTARAVADSLGGPGVGIDEFREGLLPEDEVAAIQELQRAHGPIAMVGDGVNDAPALATANLGIGWDRRSPRNRRYRAQADDLSKLATTIRLARKAERTVRANIWFSLLTKAVFVVLAVLGMATLWMAVFADMGASLLVVLNGLRTLRSARSVGRQVGRAYSAELREATSRSRISRAARLSPAMRNRSTILSPLFSSSTCSARNHCR